MIDSVVKVITIFFVAVVAILLLNLFGGLIAAHIRLPALIPRRCVGKFSQ
jgi:hypothetical protein